VVESASIILGHLGRHPVEDAADPVVPLRLEVPLRLAVAALHAIPVRAKRAGDTARPPPPPAIGPKRLVENVEMNVFVVLRLVDAAGAGDARAAGFLLGGSLGDAARAGCRRPRAASRPLAERMGGSLLGSMP
jgi:hypothetical protein